MNQEYINRINDAVEYIENNLEEELNLAIISKVALYSPFYFHRLFTSVVGENLNQFILRKRIEKAALQLKSDKSITITDVAYSSGFTSNSSFTKAFKKHYGIKPSYLKKESDALSKIRQIDSKIGQNRILIEQYICNVNNLLKHIEMNTEIKVKKMPSINVAYVTHVGAFEKIGGAYGKLMRWAGLRGLMGGKTITCYHDNLEVTEIDKLRQSACIELLKPAKPRGSVKITTIKEGDYAVGKFEVAFSEFEKSWQSMMVWVSENDCVINPDRACYEIYHNNFKSHPKKKCIIEICIPVIVE